MSQIFINPITDAQQKKIVEKQKDRDTRQRLDEQDLIIAYLLSRADTTEADTENEEGENNE